MEKQRSPEPREGCSLCQEFDSPVWPQNGRIEAFLEQAAPGGRILLEDRDLVVVPSLGPLAVGHVLIVPRAHYLSVAELPSELREQFALLYFRVWDFLEEKFGQCMAFEHGCAQAGKRGGACVDHAHMHLLPLGFDLTPDLAAVGDPEVITHVAELGRWHAEGTAYLFYESPDRVKRVWSVDAIPSQLLRMLIAHKAGTPERGDWRADFGAGWFCSTMELSRELKVSTRFAYAHAH